MATHSSILAWRIPSTEEPGWLWPIGSQRVEHNRRTQPRVPTCTHHQLRGHEFEQALGAGDGSLVCCVPWGCRVGHDFATELNPTEHTHTHTHTHTGHFNINMKTLLLNVDFIPLFVTSCLVYGSPFLAIVH